MVRAKAKPTSTDLVLLLATNRETREGLSAYLAASDITLQVRSSLEPGEFEPRIRVVVLFPDDFGDGEVASYLLHMRARRPDLSVLVVTRSPSKYKSVTDSGKRARALNVIVVPRPAFGWTLLDLVRDALARH